MCVFRALLVMCVCVCVSICACVCELYRLSKAAAIFKYLLGLLLLLLGGRLFLQCFKPDWPELFPL